jgi:hypothetical protein
MDSETKSSLINISIVLIIAGILNLIASLSGHGILYKFTNNNDIGYDLVLGYGTLAFGVTMFKSVV